MSYEGVDRRKAKHWLYKLERFLVRSRALSVIVMYWSGKIMTNIITGCDIEDATTGEAAFLVAQLTPFAAIFKFAFDFALDGKIDKD